MRLFRSVVSILSSFFRSLCTGTVHTIKAPTALYGKVEGYLGAPGLDMSVEAFFLVGCELVGQGSCGYERGEEAQEGGEKGECQHGDEGGGSCARGGVVVCLLALAQLT